MRWAATALAVAWGLPTVLVLAELGWDPAQGRGVLSALESVLGPFCHHDLDRTLFLGGRAMVVCARCSGLYAGWLLAVAWLVLPWVPARYVGRVIGMVGVAFLLAVAEPVCERAGLLDSTNAARVLLGLPLGFGPASVLILAQRACKAASSARR